MNKHRILFINHAAVMGGAEYCLLSMAIAYHENCQVLLLSDGPLRERLESEGVKVKLIQAPPSILGVRTSSGLSSLKIIPSLMRLAQKVSKMAHTFDIIHTNSQKAFVVASLAKLYGCPPIVWHLRDMMTAKHFSPFNRWLAVTLANRFASKVLVVSHAASDDFISIGGRKTLVKIMYEGMLSTPFETVEPQRITAIRQALEISNNTTLIGVFSRLSFWKGQHILIEALQKLPDNIHALIVGDALFGEEDYMSQFIEMIKSPKVSHRVHWLGFRKDIPELMSACDIIVHTSTEPEPFGRVVIEGQFSQKPVIASAAGGIFEIIENGSTGYLFKPGDSKELATIILKILNDPQNAKNIAKKGKSQSKKRFSMESFFENFNQTIESIIQGES